MNNGIAVVVLASAVAYGTPLLYAALGELLAERAGVLNLGVEGMMLVGAVMGFWAVQRIGGPGGLALFLAILVAAARRRSGRARACVSRHHAAREPDRVGARADDLRGSGRAVVLPRKRPQPRRLARASRSSSRSTRSDCRPCRSSARSSSARPGSSTCRGPRGARRALPLAHPSRAQRARRRGIAAGGGCDGNQRGRLPVRAHPGGRSVRGHRRRVLQPRDHAAMGRRPHGRCRLDRDRPRHLRVLAGRALSRGRVLLRRVSGLPFTLQARGVTIATEVLSRCPM